MLGKIVLISIKEKLGAHIIKGENIVSFVFYHRLHSDLQEGKAEERCFGFYSQRERIAGGRVKKVICTRLFKEWPLVPKRKEIVSFDETKEHTHGHVGALHILFVNILQDSRKEKRRVQIYASKNSPFPPFFPVDAVFVSPLFIRLRDRGDKCQTTP